MRRMLGIAALAVAAAGCGWNPGGSGPDASFAQPAEVPDGMVCEDWMRLPDAVQLEYALYRLAELRANDGLDAGESPPTEAQGEDLRLRMEAQCHQDTMEVAAVWRVAHDQYTIAYEAGTFLD